MRRFASLRRTADFSRLRARGQRKATTHLTLYRSYAGPRDERTLVGISISKAVGTAVVRNRLRRRLHALLQELLPLEKARLLVIPRPSAADLPFSTLNDELRRALS